MMMRKGQTAMEYLMTYGWAILIVIVVVAALYSMGVFTTSPGVPCSPCFSYFSFVDYADGTIVIRNGPRNINLSYLGFNATTKAIASPDTGSLVTLTDTLRCASNNTCDAGDDITFVNIDTTGDIEITLPYTDVDSGLTHTDTATIHN
jgi:hypothetical protein